MRIIESYRRTVILFVSVGILAISAISLTGCSGTDDNGGGEPVLLEVWADTGPDTAPVRVMPAPAPVPTANTVIRFRMPGSLEAVTVRLSGHNDATGDYVKTSASFSLTGDAPASAPLTAITIGSDGLPDGRGKVVIPSVIIPGP